jgi:hypothetical protein
VVTGKRAKGYLIRWKSLLGSGRATNQTACSRHPGRKTIGWRDLQSTGRDDRWRRYRRLRSPKETISEVGRCSLSDLENQRRSFEGQVTSKHHACLRLSSSRIRSCLNIIISPDQLYFSIRNPHLDLALTASNGSH